QGEVPRLDRPQAARVRLRPEPLERSAARGGGEVEVGVELLESLQGERPLFRARAGDAAAVRLVDQAAEQASARDRGQVTVVDEDAEEPRRGARGPPPAPP